MAKYDNERRREYDRKRREKEYKKRTKIYEELTSKEQFIGDHKIERVFFWDGKRSCPRICPHCFKWFQPSTVAHRSIYCEDTLECMVAREEWFAEQRRIASRKHQRRTQLGRKSIYKKRRMKEKGLKRVCQGKDRLGRRWRSYKCVKVIPTANLIFCPACHDIAGTIENHM